MNSETSAFAGDYGVVQSVEAVDYTTVAFTLSDVRSAELFLPLVADIAGGYVICMEAYEARVPMSSRTTRSAPGRTSSSRPPRVTVCTDVVR
jgi:hypothetical protein